MQQILLYQKLAECYNSSFPVLRLSRKRAKDKPWVTTASKQSIKKKHILFKDFILNRTTENETKYKQYNNVLRTLSERLKLITFSKNLVINKMASKRCENILDTFSVQKEPKAKFSWKACNKWGNNKKRQRNSKCPQYLFHKHRIGSFRWNNTHRTVIHGLPSK